MRHLAVAIIAVSLVACSGNTLGRRQPAELETLTLRLVFLQTQLDLLRVDVRELEHEVAELQRQIVQLEAQ